jgi:nucleotide sugar dehydrogenase
MSSDQKTSDMNVTVIGIGRLGICFALVLEKAGYNVVGVDLAPSYCKAINDRTLRSNEPSVEEFLKVAKNLRATTDLKEGVAHSDVLFLLVDTPSTGGERHYDHSKVGNVLLALNNLKVENKHIIIGCTIIPGYIAGVGRSLISDCKNCTLSYNPEFIAQGDIINGQLRPDMVLIGEGSKAAGERLQVMYEKMCVNKPIISRMSPESAEICKLGVNCFVTMKVSFANLIGDIADRTPGANKHDITRAIGADSRVGYKYLRPGYGFGGPCFPRDNRALAGYAGMVGIDGLVFKATDAYNKYHTQLQIQAALAENKDDYVFTGVAYKPSTKVAIIEESQRLAIAAALAQAGRKVTIRDFKDTVLEVRKEFGSLFQYEMIPDTEKNDEKTETHGTWSGKPHAKPESKVPAHH